MWSAGFALEWWGTRHPRPPSRRPGRGAAEAGLSGRRLFGMGTYVPVEVFDRIGLPDAARFPMAWGDLDFSLRAKEAGIPVLVEPSARLFHEVGEYDARVAGAPSASTYVGWMNDPMHNLSLSAHTEIWKRHGRRILWPLSLALRTMFLLLNFVRILFLFLHFPGNPKAAKPFERSLPSISLVYPPGPGEVHPRHDRKRPDAGLSGSRVSRPGGRSTDPRSPCCEFVPRVPFVSERDRGKADAINRGLSRATGEVLGYLNSDDVLLPGALPAVGEAFAVRSGARLPVGPRHSHEAGKRCRHTSLDPKPSSGSRTGASSRSPRPSRQVGRSRAVRRVAPPHDEYGYWLRLAARYPRRRRVSSIASWRAAGCMPTPRRSRAGAALWRRFRPREEAHGFRVALVVCREVGPSHGRAAARRRIRTPCPGARILRPFSSSSGGTRCACGAGG